MDTHPNLSISGTDFKKKSDKYVMAVTCVFGTFYYLSYVAPQMTWEFINVN